MRGIAISGAKLASLRVNGNVRIDMDHQHHVAEQKYQQHCNAVLTIYCQHTDNRIRGSDHRIRLILSSNFS